MLKRHMLSALCAAFALCAASAFAAMPDGEFAELCRSGTAEQIQQALQGGANPKARDEDHVPALVGASLRGDVGVIRALLDAGADVNAADRGGYTALMAAASSNGAPVVQALLAAGAKVDARDNTDVSALMLAAGRGHPEITALLLKAGADKALKDAEGNDALWYAKNPGGEVSKEGAAACVKLLQDASATKPATQDAGAFSAADLKRMSTFVSNFVEVRFPDFDMQKSGDADTLHLGGDPSHPMLIRFGVSHNDHNNFKSRIKRCEQDCKFPLLIDAKFVAESVKKYFDIELKHRSVSAADDQLPFHFDGKSYGFDASGAVNGGDPGQYAKVTRATKEGGIVRMTGDIYEQYNTDDPDEIIATFVVTAKPHKWNGKDTWAILSLKREWR